MSSSSARRTSRSASSTRGRGGGHAGRAVGEVAGHVVAQAGEPGGIPRRPAGLGDERVGRRDGGVLEQRGDAPVGRDGERQPRRPGSVPPARGARGTGCRAAAAGACRPTSPPPAPPASRTSARRRCRPRRRAPDRRAPSRRCPAARRCAAARRASTPAGRCARAPPWRRPARRAGAAPPGARSASRSSPSATTRPASSSTLKRMRRWAGSRPASKASGRHAHAAQRLERARDLVGQPAAARLQPRHHGGGDVRHRHERAPQLLRQRADQRGHELRPRNAGTFQSKPAARSCGSAVSGTWTVTPSWSAPGSKR